MWGSCWFLDWCSWPFPSPSPSSYFLLPWWGWAWHQLLSSRYCRHPALPFPPCRSVQACTACHNTSKDPPGELSWHPLVQMSWVTGPLGYWRDQGQRALLSAPVFSLELLWPPDIGQLWSAPVTPWGSQWGWLPLGHWQACLVWPLCWIFVRGYCHWVLYSRCWWAPPCCIKSVPCVH